MGDTALQAPYPGPILLQLRAVGAVTQQQVVRWVDKLQQMSAD